MDISQDGPGILPPQPTNPSVQSPHSLPSQLEATHDETSEPEPTVTPVSSTPSVSFPTPEEIEAAEARKAVETTEAAPVVAQIDDTKANSAFADKLEAWAEILHDHPISDQYKKSRNGVEFTPRFLAYAQERVEEDLASAAKLDEVLKDIPATAGIYGIDREIVKRYIKHSSNPDNPTEPLVVMTDAYGPDPKETNRHDPIVIDKGRIVKPNEEAWQKYHDMMADENTTHGDSKALYLEAFRAAHIGPVVNDARILDSVLNEIRSGHAAENTV